MSIDHLTTDAIDMDWCQDCNPTGDPLDEGMAQPVFQRVIEENPYTGQTYLVTHLECGHVLLTRKAADTGGGVLW